VDPDRNRVNDQLASATPPRTGNFQLKGDECFACVDGINSPAQGFACVDGINSPVAFLRDGAPTQEGPFCLPKGVLLVCVRSRLSFMWFLLLPSLYLNSKCVFCMIGVIPRVP
jgi:hypothetical protein